MNDELERLPRLPGRRGGSDGGAGGRGGSGWLGGVDGGGVQLAGGGGATSLHAGVTHFSRRQQNFDSPHISSMHLCGKVTGHLLTPLWHSQHPSPSMYGSQLVPSAQRLRTTEADWHPFSPQVLLQSVAALATTSATSIGRSKTTRSSSYAPFRPFLSVESCDSAIFA